jgi:hypothetical protein
MTDEQANKTMDWDKAEKYLQTCERIYGEIGMAGSFAMMFVINPCRVRFNAGERSQELHDEIMEIAL